VRRAKHLLACILACACPLTTTLAHATQSVSLHATLTPERLGHATTVHFGFQIAAPKGHVPPPLTQVAVDYPGELGIALSELGLATCTTTTLETYGPQACPTNSLMGYGTATAAIPIGPEIEQESANITLIRAPTQNGHLALLFYTNAVSPISAQLVFPGLLLPTPTPAPFGGRIDIAIPLVPSLPEGPDVAVIELTATLGPKHLTYYEHRHGHTIAYNPKGILLPNTCPRGGFPFAATFGFLDGTHANAHTTVPCPRHHKPRH
jgi:hypothetical protein